MQINEQTTKDIIEAIKLELTFDDVPKLIGELVVELVKRHEVLTESIKHIIDSYNKG